MFKAIVWVVAIAATLIGVAHIVPGIAITGWQTALVVAVVWGLVTLLVRPVLMLLTLPITILTLGLFSFVLNALLFWFVAYFVPGFSVSGFIPALEGSVLLTVVGWLLHAAF